jgi:hypothetical protein
MSAVLEDLALQIVEPWGSDGMEEGARSTLRHSSARCSVYLLYWYKSTKSDAFFFTMQREQRVGAPGSRQEEVRYSVDLRCFTG